MKINQKDILLRTFVLSLIAIFCIFTIPSFIGLSTGGFEEALVLDQWQFYVLMGFALIGIIIGVGYEYLVKEEDKKYGNGLGFVSLGENPGVPFFKRFTIPQITLYSLIFFLILGLLSTTGVFGFTQTTWTGIRTLPKQQYTATDSLLFSNIMIPMAENISFGFFILLIIFTSRYFARKYNWSTSTFNLTAIFLLIILSGVYAVGNHNMRYAGQEISLIIVFGFWTVGALITFLTQCFTPFWMMHLVNNLYYDLGEAFSNELVLIYAGGLIIFLVFITFIIYKGRLLGKEK